MEASDRGGSCPSIRKAPSAIRRILTIGSKVSSIEANSDDPFLSKLDRAYFGTDRQNEFVAIQAVGVSPKALSGGESGGAGAPPGLLGVRFGKKQKEQKAESIPKSQ